MIAGEHMSMLLNIYCRLFSSSEKNIDKITSFRFLKILIDWKHRVPLSQKKMTVKRSTKLMKIIIR